MYTYIHDNHCKRCVTLFNLLSCWGESKTCDFDVTLFSCVFVSCLLKPEDPPESTPNVADQAFETDENSDYEGTCVIPLERKPFCARRHPCIMN